MRRTGLAAVGAGLLVGGLALTSPAMASVDGPFVGVATSLGPVSPADPTGLTNFVAAGNLAGHGVHDLAVVDSAGDQVWALLNDGSGHFTQEFVGSTFAQPAAIAVGKLGGKGPGQDVAVVSWAGNPSAPGVLQIFRQTGAGFDPTGGNPRDLVLPVGDRPDAIAIGDLNGDGRNDIAVANKLGLGPDDPSDTGTVTLFISRPQGGYATETLTGGLGAPDQQKGPVGIAIGNLHANGTGFAKSRDIVVVNDDETMSIFLNRGPAGRRQGLPAFTPGPELDPGFDSDAVAVGNLGGSGTGDDIAVANGGGPVTRGATLLLNNGDGTFARQQLLDGVSTSPFGASIAIANLAGPSRPGFAVTNPAQGDFDGSTSIFIRDADGSFQETTVPAAAGTAAPRRWSPATSPVTTMRTTPTSRSASCSPTPST